MLCLDYFERVNHFRVLVHLIEAKLVTMGTDQTDRVIVLANNRPVWLWIDKSGIALAIPGGARDHVDWVGGIGEDFIVGVGLVLLCVLVNWECTF